MAQRKRRTELQACHSKGLRPEAELSVSSISLTRPEYLKRGQAPQHVAVNPRPDWPQAKRPCHGPGKTLLAFFGVLLKIATLQSLQHASFLPQGHQRQSVPAFRIQRHARQGEACYGLNYCCGCLSADLAFFNLVVTSSGALGPAAVATSAVVVEDVPLAPISASAAAPAVPALSTVAVVEPVATEAPVAGMALV